MADSKSGNMSSVKGKKLINDPSHCVDDSLEGFALTNPQVKLLKGHKVVIRSDVDQLIGSNKVCLISGRLTDSCFKNEAQYSLTYKN